MAEIQIINKDKEIEDVKTEDVKIEDVKTEDVKTEDVKTEPIEDIMKELFVWCPKCYTHLTNNFTVSKLKDIFTDCKHEDSEGKECVHSLEYVQSYDYEESMSIIKNTKANKNINEILKKRGYPDSFITLLWKIYNKSVEVKEIKEPKVKSQEKLKRSKEDSSKIQVEISKDKIKPIVWSLDNMAMTEGLKKFVAYIDRLVALTKTTNPTRRNIILDGPFGAGKTIMVRALAETPKYKDEIEFIDIGGTFTGFDHKDVSEAVENMFINAINNIGTKSLIIMFIDEIAGTVGSRRRASRTQKNLIDTILRLTSKYPDVIIVGTSNDLSEADKSILESGRFEIIRVGLPETPEERLKLLSVHLKNYNKDVQFDDEVFNRLIEFDEYHAGWIGRTYEDFTADVTLSYKNNNNNKITFDDLTTLFNVRNTSLEAHTKDILKNKEEEQQLLCPHCNGNTIRVGFDSQRKRRRKCKLCSKKFYEDDLMKNKSKSENKSKVEVVGDEEGLNNVFEKGKGNH